MMHGIQHDLQRTLRGELSFQIQGNSKKAIFVYKYTLVKDLKHQD